MSTQLLNLPINIPWCQIAVTEQMIDKGFGDRRFPTPWRSSMAISAFEPKTEDLPEEFKDKRITYLKITCTITGYQPSPEETKQIVDLDDGSASFAQLFDEYMACYGVMLNVAVFPAIERLQRIIVGSDNLSDYPHIIALEPKNRDLYQAATENGEILTASNSRVATDKTLTHTETTETGVSISGTVGNPKEGPSVTGGMTHKWGETNQDSRSLQTDNSRERRETQGTTTQLSQMYNLLTGYHQGTNRAAFLMLPRPHTLQTTDRRTFVQGLREIEGVQEFMLIVERPAKVEVLCVEAFLETGHFPENPDFITPKQKFDRIDVPNDVFAEAKSGLFGERHEEKFNESFTINSLGLNGYELDIEKGVEGVTEERFTDDTANVMTGGSFLYDEKPALVRRKFGIELPNKLVVDGEIRSQVNGTTIFHRQYKVHLRKPTAEPNEPHADVTQMLITQRGLEVCFKSGDGCPQVITDQRPDQTGGIADGETNAPIARFQESIVDERNISMNPNLFTAQATSETRLPATKELLRKIQNAMTTSGRLPSRYPAGAVGFLESNYFKNQIKKILPREKMRTPVGKVKGIPSEVIKRLGEKYTIAEALDLDLTAFAKKTGLDIEGASKARKLLLGFSDVSDENKAVDGNQEYDNSAK